MSDMAVFGYAAHGASTAHREIMARVSAKVGDLAGVELAVFEAMTYDELTLALTRGEVDLAWLPPIPLLYLEGEQRVIPLVSHQRRGGAEFHSVILVAAGSHIASPRQLAGKRAAWVDPFSASGYVLPRIALAALGVDPRTAFAEERFFRSHESVVRAVVSGRADFGGTYAGLDAAGKAVRGAWMGLPGAERSVRVLAAFGTIPGDTIAARSGLGVEMRERLANALLDASRNDEGRALVAEAFGVEELRPWAPSDYDVLRRALRDAREDGLLDAQAPDEEGTPPSGVPRATP